jgi:hypothetical protein
MTAIFVKKNTGQMSTCELFAKMVYDYNNGQLTVQQDAFNAFTGILGMFEVSFGKRYLWAMPGFISMRV